MPRYFFYDESGFIHQDFSCDDPRLVAKQKAIQSLSVIETNKTGDMSKYFVDVNLSKETEREDYTLDALPIPCVATIEGVAYDITEQDSFEFEDPGIYVIEIDAGSRYLKKEFIVHVD